MIVLLLEDTASIAEVFRRRFYERFPNVELLVCSSITCYMERKYEADVWVIDYHIGPTTICGLTPHADTPVCYWSDEEIPGERQFVFPKKEIDGVLDFIEISLPPRN